MKTLEHLKDHAEHLVHYSDRYLKSFTADLEKDPAHALEWSADVFRAAAQRKVGEDVLKWLKVDGVTEESFLAELERTVVNGARWPSRSTSGPSNLMAQELNAQWAEVLAKFKNL